MPIKTLLLIWIYCFQIVNLHSQATDQDFKDVYKSINSKKGNAIYLNPLDSNFTSKTAIIKETFQLLDFLNEFMDNEHRLNGKGSFSFSGNETTSGNLYKVGAGVNIDQGVYPYELDFSTNVQTLLKDGILQENVSDIDISFDFHPHTPSADARIAKYNAKIDALHKEQPVDQIGQENKQYLLEKYLKKIEQSEPLNGLWLENYIVGKRYSDGFLGIDERYELGGGFIFSFFSKALTQKGNRNRDELNRKPSYSFQGEDLIRCLTSCAPIHNVLMLSNAETQVLSETRARYLVSNQKQYSQLRLSLLIGAYYELEKVTATNTILFNGKDTSLSYDFKPTNKLRGEIRPGFVWRPKDKYKLKIYPFMKFPLDRIYNIVREGNLIDDRLDYYMDLFSSLDIQIENNFSINIFYRMIYDNAPSRIFLKQLDHSFVLLSAEKKRSSFGIGLSFGF